MYLALLVLIIVGFVILVGQKCGHGLTSRPRESSSELFLNELSSLFRYPPKSGRALLTGTLPLWYCAARFACKTPTWRLPVSGHVARFIAVHCEDAGGRGDEVPDLGVHWVSRSGPGRKRIRLNRKTPAHLMGCIGSFSSTCLEEIASGGFFLIFLCLITQGGVVIMHYGGILFMNMTEIGVRVISLGHCAGPRLQVCTSLFN